MPSRCPRAAQFWAQRSPMGDERSLFQGAVGIKMAEGKFATPAALEAPSREAIVALREMLPLEHRRPPHQAAAYTFEAKQGLFSGRLGQAKLYAGIALLSIVAGFFAGNFGPLLQFFLAPILLFRAGAAYFKHRTLTKNKRPRLRWPVPTRPGR